MVTVTIMKRLTTFIIVSLILTSVFLISNTYSASAQIPMKRENNTSKFILKIDGIDYSILKAQVWITAGSITILKIINPISLLDPDDDGNGIILVPLEFKKGLLKAGEKFTACIKVLHDDDKFGNHLACKKGIMSNMQLLEPQLAGADKSENNNNVVRLSL
jgi:hypothetical protein